MILPIVLFCGSGPVLLRRRVPLPRMYVHAYLAVSQPSYLPTSRASLQPLIQASILSRCESLALPHRVPEPYIMCVTRAQHLHMHFVRAQVLDDELILPKFHETGNINIIESYCYFSSSNKKNSQNTNTNTIPSFNYSVFLTEKLNYIYFIFQI